MKANGRQILVVPDKTIENPRREFLKKGALLGTLAGITGISLVTGCKEEPEEEISPAEDLMREHGILNRVMLIYDSCRVKLAKMEQFPVQPLQDAAQIIRTFIENYHEKLEEEFIFPRFTNANQLVDLVQTLYIQHSTGRKITEQIIQLASMTTLKNTDDAQKLIALLNDFNRMYRPHEAREDTVLFPALKKLVSGNEYSSMGEDFEKKEHELFGQEGFEGVVVRVGDIEKQLGIYDLSAFTPIV